jgi:biotin carboxylase
MSRLLLLVSTHSYRAGAFLAAARRMGIDVAVAGDREQALASLNPAGHLTLDFADPLAARDRVVAFANEVPLGAVIAADDEGTPIAALAAEAQGWRHASFASVYATRSKLRLREAQQRAGLRTPWFRALSIGEPADGAAHEVRYPCVLKPVHLAASRGVLRADDPRELITAIGRVRALLDRPDTPRLWIDPRAGGTVREAELLIEEYLPGVELAIEGLLSGGTLRVLAVFDKPDPLEGPTFEESIYVTPSRLEPLALASAVAAVEAAVAALGLREGPVHAEVRVDDRGAWLIEIAPRSIGGLCSRMLRFGDGVTLEELLLRHALGWDTDALRLAPEAAGVMMVPIPGAGTLRAVHGRSEAAGVAGIEDVRITIPIGQELVPLPEGSRYLGFLFARGDSAEGVESALRRSHAALRFEIETRHEGNEERDGSNPVRADRPPDSTERAPGGGIRW